VPAARALAAAWIASALWACGERPAQPPLNYVEIGPRLATSAQPSAAYLETLKARGFEAVIYLAPPTVPDAVRDEPLILGRQGLVYLNVPVDFAAPADADFEAFSRALAALEGRKVLVHCQANFRASSFVFLHRVIHGKVEPEKAWESVSRVWQPDAAWRAFVLRTLKRHQVAFEPL
jgi:protein tyrosine phosphatase (PTP) superfamily phosphohydrolase (DUF442 family)